MHKQLSEFTIRQSGLQERAGSAASDLPTGDSVIADVRSRLSAGVKGLNARLGRTSSSAGAAAGDALSEDGSRDGSSESGAAAAPAQHRSVAQTPDAARRSIAGRACSTFTCVPRVLDDILCAPGRSVTDRLADKFGDVRRTFLDQPRPAPASSPAGQVRLLGVLLICTAKDASQEPIGQSLACECDLGP